MIRRDETSRDATHGAHIAKRYGQNEYHTENVKKHCGNLLVVYLANLSHFISFRCFIVNENIKCMVSDRQFDTIYYECVTPLPTVYA